jgi:lipopolysaccharide transport system ATP-binding protein
VDPRIVIRAEALSKRLDLGSTPGPRDLREAIGGWWGRRPKREPRHVWALRDVDFEVEQGEVVGIVGNNGAGKTTLLRILSRITAPTSGRAEIRGRVASLLEVGTGFHPELTGRENVYLNGAILGMRRAEIARRFDEIVAFAGVEGFLDTPIKRYSSGMRVRLAFAVAAHLEPDVLIIDEVLAVGDVAFQSQCLRKMSEIARSGRTVLFVSHSMGAVEALCTRAILLDQGRIVASGGVPEVVRQYIARTWSHEARDAPAMFESHDGQLRVRDVEICDLDGARVGALQPGQSFALRISLWAARRQPGLKIQVALNDELGVRTAVLSSATSGQPLDVPAGPSTVLCVAQEVPLVPGVYALELKAVADRKELLVAHRAAELPIEGGDFFKAGTLPPECTSGRVLLRQSWSIEADAP